MTKVFNIGPIDHDASHLGNSTAQTRYKVATLRYNKTVDALSEAERQLAERRSKLKKGEDNKDLKSSIGKLTKRIGNLEDAVIEAGEKQIEAWDMVVDMIGRTCEVANDEGETIPAADLPASVVDQIFNQMAAERAEMSDPNDSAPV